MKLPRPAGLPRRIPAWAWKWLRWRQGKKPAPQPPAPKPVQLFMYDDVNVDLIPANAEAVAGYVGGKWQTYYVVVKKWPHAKHLSIAVAHEENADCLDVEPGDSTPDWAAVWVKRQLALRKSGNGYNTTKPVVYTNASSGQALIAKLSAAGLKYGEDYLWWSAHYDPALGKHLCGPRCGFGLKQMAHATQFTDKAEGKSLDESVVTQGFFA